MSRPHEPTDETRKLVRILKATANSHKTIAMILEIDEKTLMKRYRQELDYGLEHTRAQIGAAVARSAMQGNIAAAAFFLARFGGADWKQPKDDNEGSGGATIIVRGGIASVKHEPETSE